MRYVKIDLGANEKLNAKEYACAPGLRPRLRSRPGRFGWQGLNPARSHRKMLQNQPSEIGTDLSVVKVKWNKDFQRRTQAEPRWAVVAGVAQRSAIDIFTCELVVSTHFTYILVE